MHEIMSGIGQRFNFKSVAKLFVDAEIVLTRNALSVYSCRANRQYLRRLKTVDGTNDA
jgi:hypothetical protein